MTVQEWLDNAKQQLTIAGIPSALLDSELLLSYAIEQDRPWLLAHDQDPLSIQTHLDANALLKRRIQREPLAYIRGWQEFYGREFKVTPAVLVPRPESEAFIELLKKLPQPLRGALVDIGTGSGILGVTASLEFPELSVFATDISTNALAIAQENGAKLKAHVSFVQSNLLDAITSKTNIIVANLPYVDASWQCSPETAFEPSLALFANNEGLALIYQLVEQAQLKLTTHGYLFLEADPRQFAKIKAAALAHGFNLLATEGFILQFQKI